jgi:hypothetical protein
MVRFGEAPYLECSSKGDKRFSAFSARLDYTGGASIEECYQSFMVFEDGSTGLSWREAKGKRAVNQSECSEYYRFLWREFFKENPKLLEFVKTQSGFSDIFGQKGHCCQAEEIWRITNGI